MGLVYSMSGTPAAEVEIVQASCWKKPGSGLNPETGESAASDPEYAEVNAKRQESINGLWFITPPPRSAHAKSPRSPRRSMQLLHLLLFACSVLAGVPLRIPRPYPGFFRELGCGSVVAAGGISLWDVNPIASAVVMGTGAVFCAEVYAGIWNSPSNESRAASRFIEAPTFHDYGDEVYFYPTGANSSITIHWPNRTAEIILVFKSFS